MELKLDKIQLPIYNDPILKYLGTCIKRLIEPHLSRYERYQNAKTDQNLIKRYPLKRIEYALDIIKKNEDCIPEATKKDFFNALTIGIFSQDYINAESESKCEKNIDEEWLNRFIDEAKYISDEKLQQLFARLLKEKIYNPDAVNKRVINIIKNIDASELETIQTYMTYFVAGALSSAIVYEMPLSLDALTNLANIGLMNFVAAPAQSQIEIRIDITPTTNKINVKGYDFIFNGVTNEFCITFDSPYILTKEGRAVYDIITVPMPTDVCEMYKHVFESQCNGKCIMEIKKTF